MRFPAYTSATALPLTWIEGPTQNRTVFKMRSSHWAFNMVSNFAYAHWDTVKPVVQAKIVAMEASFAEQLATMDATAAKIMTQHGTAAAVEALTNFTIRTGDGLVDDWNIFFGELFVRFGDGFDASPTPRSAKQTVSEPYTNGGTSTVDVKETGYDEAWYARIAQDAGGKYHVPATGSTEEAFIDPRLSTDRLHFM